MPVIQQLKPHTKDIGGGFVVRRLLPAATQRSVGPFIFLDHFGPIVHHPSDNFDVRPHPHIGLATVTYLFEGAMQHRDNLGYSQRIEPGAINWMTAGSGIVHSERTPPDLRATPYTVHGLQLWAALPAAQEECAPSFSHTPADAIPVWRDDAAEVRVLIGSAFGLTSPVATFAKTLYLDIALRAGTTIALPCDHAEIALYPISGDVEIDGSIVEPGQLAILDRAQPAIVTALQAARFVVLGGDALDGYRFMWWNFVSSRKERIEQAKEDWRTQRMGQVPGETELIPLPE